jgi:hypothetical protein
MHGCTGRRLKPAPCRQPCAHQIYIRRLVYERRRRKRGELIQLRDRAVYQMELACTARSQIAVLFDKSIACSLGSILLQSALGISPLVSSGLLQLAVAIVEVPRHTA